VVTAPLMYLFFNNSSPTPDQKFFEKYFDKTKEGKKIKKARQKLEKIKKKKNRTIK
jgi:hypothetical protein